MDTYKEVVRLAAQRKLVDLAKCFLDIIDELKKEESARIDNLISVAKENGIEEKIKPFHSFLFLLDDNKKEIVRKRILDETNKLIRELDL